MDYKRIFRVVVCLLVICCLVLNLAAPRVRAIEPVSTALGIGCAAALILMAAGVVFHPQTAADITAIGNSMTSYLDTWAVENDKVQEVQDWYFGIQFYDGGSDEDGDGEEDTPHQRQVLLARGILAGITAWVASVILGVSEIETEDTNCDDVVYGSTIYPNILNTFSSEYLSQWRPYQVIVTKSGSTFLILSSEPWYYTSSSASSMKCDSFSYFHSLDTSGWKWSSNYITSYSAGTSYTPGGIRWSNHDICYNGTVRTAGTEPVYDIKTLSPNAFLGDIPTGIQDGTLTADGITLPDVLDYTELVPLGKPATDAIIDTSQGLIAGTLTYEDYLQIIDKAADTGTDTEPDSTAPSEPVLLPGTLGDTDAGTFLDALLGPFREMFEWLGKYLLDGLASLFIPSEGFLEAKVDALISEFGFVKSIAQTGNAFKTFFVDMGMKPPIIYIDFSAARGMFSPGGEYALGGKTVFLDLTWYAEYKPTVDALLSAFLWLWFCWRMLLSLPGILQGTSGMWGSGDSLAGFEPWAAPRRLDSGSSGRLLGTSEHHQRFNSERKRFWER